MLCRVAALAFKCSDWILHSIALAPHLRIFIILTTIWCVGSKFYIQQNLIDVLYRVAVLVFKYTYLIFHSGKNMIPSGVKHWQNISRASEKLPYPDYYLLSWMQQILCSAKPDLNRRRVMQSSYINVPMLLFDLPQQKEELWYPAMSNMNRELAQHIRASLILIIICCVGGSKYYVQSKLTIIMDVLICRLAVLAFKYSYLIFHNRKNMIPSGVKNWQSISTAS